eukprot:maker-scaffold_5-snap-gene-18.54-mRNA-1 protein AED:0.01 eAED:0.01 QI:306/1/1/1/1/1/2/215/222
MLALLLGKPGCGKGSIAKLLKEKYSFQHISVGDILRNQMRQETTLGKEAAGYVNSGALVPDKLVTDMVLHELTEFPKLSNVLLDGFPRTLTQAHSLDTNKKVDAVLQISVPDTEIVHRLSDRWVHEPSGRVYSYSGVSVPKVKGKDDDTGEDLIRRKDDEPETVKQRLKVYEDSMTPVLHYFEKLNLLKEFTGETTKSGLELVKQDKRSLAIFQEIEKHLKL